MHLLQNQHEKSAFQLLIKNYLDLTEKLASLLIKAPNQNKRILICNLIQQFVHLKDTIHAI